MKKRFLGILLCVMLIIVCVGCGAENSTTEQTETSTATTTEENIPEQTEEATAAPEETVEQAPEVTEAPIEEVATETEATEITPVPTIEPETAEKPVPTAEPEPTAESVPEYSYTDMSATMYAIQTVNVRNLPSADGEKVGSLSTNQEVTVTGQCNETGWYRIEYNGETAYVSNNYLNTEKVEVQQSTGNSPANGSTSNGVSRNAADYRSISSLSELSYVGDGWDTDYAGFCANYKNIEKVTYTHNGITVLLYDYRMIRTYGTYSDGTPWTSENVLLYDFSYPNMPWCQVAISEVDSYIDNGGYTSSWGFNPISNYQVYQK